MADTNGSNVEKYLAVLQHCYLSAALSGFSPKLSLTQIEPDRRKHSRIARELIAEGWIQTKEDGGAIRFLITEQVLDSLPEIAIDLCEMWRVSIDWSSSRQTAHYRPWVRLQYMDAVQKKSILRSKTFDFFAVNREAYAHFGKLADARATICEASRNKYQQFWDGTYDTLSDALKVLGLSPDLMLCVSSPELRAFVEAELQAREFNALFLANTLWGLVECGVVEQSLVFDADDKPLIDSQFYVRSIPFMSGGQQSPADSEQWASNLTTSIEQLETQVQNLNQRLITLRRIAQGIEAYGGWEKFKHNYSEKLREHLAKM
jgi:hypothetical protein